MLRRCDMTITAHIISVGHCPSDSCLLNYDDCRRHCWCKCRRLRDL